MKNPLADSPSGMPPFTVTALSAVAGYTLSRAFKNNAWYRNRTLKNLDLMVERGHLSKEKAEYYRTS